MSIQHGGVMVGDRLIRVDGSECKGMIRDDIKRRVVGPPNSEVLLTFRRAEQTITVLTSCSSTS